MCIQGTTPDLVILFISFLMNEEWKVGWREFLFDDFNDCDITPKIFKVSVWKVFPNQANQGK